MAGITIADVSKSYGGEAENLAVSGLNLEIRDNTFVTLLGPSGCGKTTTLRLIAGYLVPDAGTIHVGSRLISSPGSVVPPEARGMGMVFQNYAVWPHKTVFENVVFGLRVRKVPAHQAREQVGRALALVNLSGLESRLPGELSGGQQQRVALARSLVVEPEILLLDEPLSNLDAKLREKMRGELKQLQRRTGITFVYVTHDQAEALALSDQIAVMHGGVLQQFGTPQEVYSRPANRIVADFMGLVNLLPGRIESAANGEARIESAGGFSFTLALPKGMAQGAAVEVSIRPENITIAPDLSASPAAAHGTIREQTFLGNINEYFVSLGGGEELRVQTHPSQQFAIGQRVAVSVAAEHCNLFPRADLKSRAA
ncbi:MAG: ABC transporter ATP-binding protein [Rhodomicrobiaceae bacterium]